jgi:ABC-type transport system substrate-binding protein
MTRRFPLSLVMALAVAALTSGLARPAGGTAEARKGGTLRISTPSDVDYVDPALGWFPRSFMLGFGTCAKLFNYPDRQGAEGTKLIPPRSCGRTPFRVTGGTYTFDSHRTFRFHTGAPVTAQSFSDALDRVANPKLGSPATNYSAKSSAPTT